jgi:hypothetical protein
MRAFKTIRLAGLVLLLLSLVTCSGDFSGGDSPGLRIQALVFPTDIRLTTDSADQSNPAIAYDPVNNKYLIVWEDDRNSNSNATDIYGRLCDATDLNSGNCSGSEFIISSTNAMEKEPAVAFDRVNKKYLVVWTDGTYKKIRGRYINPDGSSGDAFDLITTGNPSQPSLVFNEVTQKFNLVWREENNTFDTNNVINNPPLQGSKCSNTYPLNYIPQPYADNYAVVSGEIASGSTSITGNTFSGFVWISGPSDNGNDAITASWLVHRQETSPAVFYDPVSGDTYVAWAGKKATISVNVKYSCPSGQNPPCPCTYQETWSESNVDSYQKVYVRKRTTSIVYDLTFSASDSFSPSVTIDPNTRRALLVWEEQTQNNGKDIKGEIIDLSNWQAYQAVTVSSAPSDQTRPRVSFDNVNQRYMVVWEDAGSIDIPNIDIYGQFIDPQGQLSGSNFPVTTYEKNQLLPALAFGDTDFRYFFIIWKDGRIPGNADIYGNLWQYSVAPQLEITDENNNPLPADTIDFGSVMTGQSVSRVFRIWNKGNSPLTIRGHQDPASPFNISTTWPTTINPGTYYNMTVTFSPTQKGSFNSTITINSDGGNKTIYLSGNSVEPDIDVSSTSLNFETVDVGISKTLSLTISNTGNADLTVSSMTTETPFTISESPFTLQPGGSKTIAVTFTPQSGDSFTKQLVIISNDPDEGSLTVNLTGTGNAVVTITTTSLRAGTVGGSYSETLKATGGRKPYTWSIAEGSLPRGLDLAPQTGVISGKPTAIGEYNFTVKVTDADGRVAMKELSIMVYNPITITTTGLKPWTKDVGGYSETLQASGGDGSYTWSIVSGNLPNGLSLSFNQITWQITGTPTLAGDYTFTLRVTDGTGAYQEKEYTIRINAPLQITTDSLPNGTKGVAYSLGINYTGGTAPYTWNATGLPDGLVIDGATGVISGVPTQAGQSTVTITLQDATGAQVQKSYTLKIYNPPDIDISPNTFSFGDVGIGLSKDIVVTMKNTGEAPLTVNTLQLNGSGFVLLNAPQTPFTLNQNASQIFTIRFQPSANVNYSGILTITSNDPDEGNLTYTLTGRGVNPPDIDVTPSLVDFGTVVAGQSKDITVKIINNITNGADLVISNITVSGHGYTLPTPPSYPITLSAGNTYQVTIKFTPPTSGQFSGSLTISSNDPDEGSFKVDLKGNGSVPPDISVSPASLDFGDVLLYQSKTLTLTISNSGGSNLQITNIQITGAGFSFKTQPQVPVTIQPGGNPVSIEVLFIPLNAQDYTGQITITSNDPDSPTTIQLTGRGISAPNIEVTPASLDFGKVQINTTHDKTVTIKNTGTEVLNISSITIPISQAFTIVSQSPTQVPEGEVRNVTVRFSPTGELPYAGNLIISSNDPDTPSIQVPLTGEGTSQAGPGGGGGGENISSKGGGCSIGGAMNKPSQVANMVVLLLPLIFVGLRRFVKGIGGK